MPEDSTDSRTTGDPSISARHSTSVQRISSNATLQVFSNSLRDAKRNADSILHSAQNSEPVLRIRSGLDQWETSVRADVLRAQKSATQQLERLKLAEPRFSAGFPRPRTGSAADDGVLIKRLTQGGEGKKLPGVRRVKSSADLTRPRRSSGKSTALADTGSPRGVLHANSEVVAAAAQWDLVSVLQNSITSANGRTPGGQPMYPMLPAPGLADSKLVDGQATGSGTQQPGGLMLRNTQAAKRVEAVANSLLAGPKTALASCQATQANLQANVRMLSDYVQHSLPTALPRLTVAGGGAVSPTASEAITGSHFTTNSALRAPSSATSAAAEAAEADGGAAASAAWAPLAALAAREVTAVEQVLGGEPGALSREEQRTADLAQRQTLQAERRRKRRAALEGRSSLQEGGRNVAIVTTAALPWMTGTAVNPLLRAAYLAHEEEKRGDKGSQVTLVIPWLAAADQAKVYPNNLTFSTPEEQESYVRAWVSKRTGFDCNFKVTFYPGRYAGEKGSILPVGDPTTYIPDNEADVAVLEEPEHLTWFHHGTRWTDKFTHVVGIMHTNYLDYARREENGQFKEQFLGALNQLVTRMHCDKVVKLSDAVQPLPRQTTEFVHGVPDSFLRVGERKAADPADGQPRFTRGAYFMGKAVWAKGYTELLDLVARHTAAEGGPEKAPAIDCYGNGEDLPAVEASSRAKQLPLTFHGAKDHLDDSMHEYKVFINPSKSDVVATTTAEALAMGKWAIVQEHPSNEFFSTFSNCLVYKTPEEFSKHRNFALQTDPHPLKEEERKRLTWEDATQRFLKVAELGPQDRQSPLEAAVDTAYWNVYNNLTGQEQLRIAMGAGVQTRDNPAVPLEQFQPAQDTGGIFDRGAAGRRPLRLTARAAAR